MSSTACGDITMKNRYFRHQLKHWLQCLFGKFFFAFLWVFCIPFSAKADSSSVELKWSAYADVYYAYDLNNPPGNSRNPLPLILSTQAARHNEFNVNLAYIDARLRSDRIRGRLALQSGTAVPANYTNEGTNIFSQIIQEAYAGYQIADRLWIDAGIYFSSIGFESWISKENWTYTRSLMSDFTPYYQSGVRLSYEMNSRWSAQVNVTNGWQNITENNDNKAVNFQLAYTPSESLTLIYNNFYGNETANQPRLFNQLIARVNLTQLWQIAGIVDYGLQKKSDLNEFLDWHQFTLLSIYQLTPTLSLAGRFESYIDQNGIIVPTQTPHGFNTQGASVGTNIQLHKNLLFRNELRGSWSKDNIYAAKEGLKNSAVFLVTALTLSLE
jgi:hypothetical protein